MDNDLEEIRQKLDIVEFIGQYVSLKKAGLNYKGLCPFHEERTPSMIVSPEKQIFKCFGCNEGGDIFSFVQKRENLDFPETVKLLADRAGVVLKRDNTPRIGSDDKTRLFNLNKLVNTIFQKLLTEHKSGEQSLKYLISRGIDLKTIKFFNLGWCPTDTSFLMQLGRKKGYNEREFSQIGSPERLRGRITFPLTDILGNVVGFSGRSLDPNRQPKYLNTPDTIIFHKSNIIYNLSNCRDAIKNNNRIVLVEGQMDVVASVQSGIKETVATSGTALTENQLRILYRYSDRLIIAYDSDSAGINATKRAIQLALPIGFTIYVAQVTSGKDPGDMAVEYPEKWKKLIEKPKHFLDWLYEVTTTEFSKQSIMAQEQKRKLAKELIPTVQLIEDPIALEEATRKLAVILQTSTTAASELIAKSNAQNPKKDDTVFTASIVENKDWLSIGMIYLFPMFITKLDKVAKFNDKEAGQIYTEIQKEYNKFVEKGEKPSNKLLKSRLTRAITNQLDDLSLEIQKKFNLEDQTEVKQIFFDIFQYFQQSQRDLLKQQFAQSIREAEESGDREKVKKLLAQLGDLIK